MIKKQRLTNLERNGVSRKNSSAKVSQRNVLIVLTPTVPKANQEKSVNTSQLRLFLNYKLPRNTLKNRYAFPAALFLRVMMLPFAQP